MPGTLKAPLDASQPDMRVIQYSAKSFAENELHDLSKLADIISESVVTWINVDGLADTQAIQQIGDAFGLHRLALEDVLNVHQRAKVDRYDDYLYIVLRMMSAGERLQSEQLSIFLSQRLVLTIQERPGDCLDPVRERLRGSRGRIRDAGAGYLAYALIDAVVDAYFPIVDEYAERLETLEIRVSSGHSAQVIAEIHDLRGDLMQLRRAIRPLRDALVLLMPDQNSLFDQGMHIYLRDCYDHTVQLIDLLDTYREMCSDLRDYHMSVVSQHMNEVMKVLTMIATVFIPLSFIAGVYGMNFNTKFPGNMPELNWPFGYVSVLTVMLVIATVMVNFFWRRGWLSNSEAHVWQSENETERQPNEQRGG